MSDKPLQLTRNQLAEFLPNSRAVRAFEQLLKQVGELIPADVQTLTRLVKEAAIEAASGSASARSALDSLDRLSNALELLALSPGKFSCHCDAQIQNLPLDQQILKRLDGLSLNPPISSVVPNGPAGGVLSGAYPNPGFAVDMATQAELDAHTGATTAHGITGAVVGTSDSQTLSNKTFSNNPTLSAGTANGIAYLNGSKVLSSGAGLCFDGNNLIVGTGSTTASEHNIQRAVSSAGQIILRLNNSDGGGYHRFCWADFATWNSANSAYLIGKVNATGRSINAAGTVNANGADYAEYVKKSDLHLDHIFAKGDVVGIDANGELTPIYREAVSFAIKSTDPGYVGGDAWGSSDVVGHRPAEPTRVLDVLDNDGGVIEVGDTDDQWAEKLNSFQVALHEFESRLNIERSKYDRVAFCGQVPVNIQGAKPGQFLIPIESSSGAIQLQGVDKPNFDDYLKCVGKVIAIYDDGRAKIIVKIS